MVARVAYISPSGVAGQFCVEGRNMKLGSPSIHLFRQIVSRANSSLRHLLAFKGVEKSYMNPLM